MNKEKIEQLIHLKLSSEINPEDLSLLNTWIEESDENRKFYESYLQLWDDFSVPEEEIDIEKAYQKFENNKVKNTSSRLQYWVAAASILLIFSYLLIFSSSTSFDTEMTRSDLTLNDGSRIKLNRFSEITYEYTDTERKITLDGEGFFEVKKDGRPFIVETSDALIKVLGTKFVVEEKNGNTQVSVIEGRVLFRSQKDTSKQIILTKNMMSQSTDFKPGDEDFESSISWIKNRIVFNDMLIEDIIKELEHDFHVAIIIDKKELNNKRINTTMNDINLEEILTSIAKLFDAKVILEEGSYHIR